MGKDKVFWDAQEKGSFSVEIIRRVFPWRARDLLWSWRKDGGFTTVTWPSGNYVSQDPAPCIRSR